MERLRAASTAQPQLLALLQEAGRIQACGACCLRLAGVRDAQAYSCSSLPHTAAGVVAALVQPRDAAEAATAAAALAGNSGIAAAPAPPPEVASDGNKRRRLDSEGGTQAAGEGSAHDAAGPAGSAPLCPLCLGLLQAAAPMGGQGSASDGSSSRLCCSFQLVTTVSSLNDPCRHASIAWHAAAPAGAPAADGPGGGSMAAASAGLAGGAAAAAARTASAAACTEAAAAGAPPDHGAPVVELRCTPVAGLSAAAAAMNAEFDFPSFGLEVSLPASLAVRQQALSWRLCQAGQAEAAKELAAAVDVKEAVRLHYGHALAAALGKPHDPQATLRIALSVSHPSAAADCSWLAPSGGGGCGKQRRGRGRNDRQHQQQQRQQPAPEVPALTDSVVQRLASLSQEGFASKCPAAAAQLAPPQVAATVQVQARRKPVHVGGRYLKLRRGIPQSPWFIDGQRKGEGSVQEAIEQAVLPALQADSYTMVSAGREDIDVRMMGTGRPFILEIHNARRDMLPADQLQRLEAAVLQASSGGVAVRGLRAASAAELADLKEGEQEKEKSYVAVCWLPRALTDGDVELLAGTRALEVQQQTPIRVLHRRANLCRPKVVHELRAERLPSQPPNYFALHLRTQAGTYVKEFVHGDMGRTQPCLGDLLGCQAQIVSLDVMQIHMPFGEED